MHELRCKGNVLHGLVEEDPKPQGVVEFRCKSRFCGNEPGVIVLHRFDLETGELNTRRYKDPSTLLERGVNDPSDHNSAVRLS